MFDANSLKECSMEVNEQDLRSRCSRRELGLTFKWSNAGV